MTDPQKNDTEHLRLLSIFYYIFAGLTALFALFPAIYLVIGIVMVVAPEEMAGQGEAPPAFLGWMMIGFSAAGMLFLWGLAFLDLLTARFLARRKHRNFCIVISALACATFPPLGTALGVFAIIVLMQESVAKLFNAGDSTAPVSALDEFDDSFDQA